MASGKDRFESKVRPLFTKRWLLTPRIYGLSSSWAHSAGTVNNSLPNGQQWPLNSRVLAKTLSSVTSMRPWTKWTGQYSKSTRLTVRSLTRPISLFTVKTRWSLSGTEAKTSPDLFSKRSIPFTTWTPPALRKGHQLTASARLPLLRVMAANTEYLKSANWDISNARIFATKTVHYVD